MSRTTPDTAELLAVGRHILRGCGQGDVYDVPDDEVTARLQQLERDAAVGGLSLNVHVLRLTAQADHDIAERNVRCRACRTPRGDTPDGWTRGALGHLCPACTAVNESRVAAYREQQRTGLAA